MTPGLPGHAVLRVDEVDLRSPAPPALDRRLDVARLGPSAGALGGDALVPPGTQDAVVIGALLPDGEALALLLCTANEMPPRAETPPRDRRAHAEGGADAVHLPRLHPTVDGDRDRPVTARRCSRRRAGRRSPRDASEGMLMLQVDQHDDGGRTVLTLTGELDASAVVGFRDRLAGARAGIVVLDLARVAFMDSAGLGAVIGAMRRIRHAGGDVVLVSPRPPLRRLLQTAGIDRIVEILDSLDDALDGSAAP